jgi:hypothetical protein
VAVFTVTQGASAPVAQTIEGFALDVDQILVYTDSSGYVPWIVEETRDDVAGTVFTYWWDREVWLPGVTGATTYTQFTQPANPERYLELVPPGAGVVFEPTPGAGAPWTTTVLSQAIPTIKWVVVDSEHVWRDGGHDVATTGSVEITPTFVETGDYLMVMDANDILFSVITSAVTVVEGEEGGGEDAGAGPPAGWVKVVNDQFDGTSLNTSIWRHPDYGVWQQPSASAWYDRTNHTRLQGGECICSQDWVNGAYRVSGQQQGMQNSDPNAYGYHPGYMDFHVRFRARYSHLHAPGVGWYFLMWPADNRWTTEFDILETPGDGSGNKTRMQSTIHFNPLGDGPISGNLGTARHDASETYKEGIDLSQWHIFEARRTIDNQGRATLTVWIDGEQLPRPAKWVNNPRMSEPMMMGFSGFAMNGGWYGPGWGGGTPATLNYAAHLSEVELWVPGDGVPATEHLLEATLSASVSVEGELPLLPGEGRTFTFTPNQGAGGFVIIPDFVLGTDRIVINQIDDYGPWVLQTTRSGVLGTEYRYWWNNNVVWLPGVIGATAEKIENPETVPTEIPFVATLQLGVNASANLTLDAAPPQVGRVFTTTPNQTGYITVEDFVVGVDRIENHPIDGYVPWVRPFTVNGVAGVEYRYWYNENDNAVWLPGITGVTREQLENVTPQPILLRSTVSPLALHLMGDLTAEQDATGVPLAATLDMSFSMGATLEVPDFNPVRLHLLVRGQSNARYLMESSGGFEGQARLRSEIERLLGFDGVSSQVVFIYERLDQATATVAENAAFVGGWVQRSGNDWAPLAPLDALTARINLLSPADKAEPAAVIWLHSDGDAQAGVSAAEWASAVRFDAARVRAMWGKTPAELPYLFVDALPVWAPDAGHQAIRQGMESLVEDPTFGATIAARGLDINATRQNTDGNVSTVDYGGTRIDDADVLQLADRIARVVAAGYRNLARIGAPVSLQGLNFRWRGPQVVLADPVEWNRLLLTVDHQGAPAGLQTLGAAAEAGVGWSVRDGSTVRVATAAELIDGSNLLVTFDGALPTNGLLFYGYGYGRLAGADGRGRGNAVYDLAALPIWVSADGLGLAGVPPQEPGGDPPDPVLFQATVQATVTLTADLSTYRLLAANLAAGLTLQGDLTLTPDMLLQGTLQVGMALQGSLATAITMDAALPVTVTLSAPELSRPNNAWEPLHPSDTCAVWLPAASPCGPGEE